MGSNIRIGTRDSELAVWQATLVQEQLINAGYPATLVYIKSEGDLDLTTPLYEMGVQGIFTRSLDIALLNGSVDVAVHSMKDVPTQLPPGISQAAVLKRGNYKDLFIPGSGSFAGANGNFLDSLTATDKVFFAEDFSLAVGTSSIRRKAQWLNRYPGTVIENLRGNVNTRLQKLADSNWQGAIFAAAGVERIGLRPQNAIELDWMLPAPAQGAIMVVCRTADETLSADLSVLNHKPTADCAFIEREFLRALLGGCSTPISALAVPDGKKLIHFKGSIVSPDGKEKIEIERHVALEQVRDAGISLAHELLKNGGDEIARSIRNA